jgi:hypothetical protein
MKIRETEFRPGQIVPVTGIYGRYFHGVSKKEFIEVESRKRFPPNPKKEEYYILLSGKVYEQFYLF